MKTTCKQFLAPGILGLLLTANVAYAQETQPLGTRGGPTKDDLQYSGEFAPGTREALHRLLKGYPPSFIQVLQLDPSLLSNPEYLKPYPQLSEFLRQHPEIAHNPAYFLGNPDYPYQVFQPRDTPVEDFFEGLIFFSIFGLIAGTLFWVARTFINHRRWLRLSKLQADANAKLMERFTSNEDFLNFIQSPAGSRFLESSAAPVEPRAIGAPVSRILWSTQVGFVLLAIGTGFELLTARVGSVASGINQQEFRMMFDTFGILILAAGIGFVISAFLSYILSQKLGLFDSIRMTSPPGGTIQKPS